MKLSLICPVWNTPRALFRACLASVVNLPGATSENFEAIFIDDGSTDGSGKMLDAAAEDCQYMRVVHQKNRGNGAARNLGIEMATGDYIAFLDCDDALLPNYLGDALQTIRTGHYDIYHFNFFKKREKDDPMLYPMFPHSYGDNNFPGFQTQTWVYAWAKLIRRGLIVENGIRFPEPKRDVPRLYSGPYRNYVRGEDNYFCAMLLSRAGFEHLVPWFGVVHVIRTSSLGQRTKGKDVNGDLGLYLTHRALRDEAVRRGDGALEEFAQKTMRTYWGLCDPNERAVCPVGYEYDEA